VIGVVGSGICHIVQNLLAREAKSLSHCQTADGTEGAFSIDVQTFAFATTHVEGQLTCHCQCMANLTLSCPELAEDLCNGTCFDAAS
jgi:hypothetical protein